MKKGFIIVAIILIAAGLATLAGAVAASLSSSAALDGAKYETNTYTPDKDFENIEIDLREADVALKPSADGKVSIVCVERENTKYNATVENGTLKISVDDQRKWYEHFSFFTKSPSVTVYLPSDSYGTLKIENRTGRVAVSDAFTFTKVYAATTTGDIYLEKICADKITLAASTGSIHLGYTSCADAVSVTVGTGDTVFENVTCKSLVFDGSTGGVLLKNTVAAGNFRITLGTGNVRFENCDAENITVKTSTGSVTGTLLSEKVFVTKTSTGSVRVPNTSSGGRCEITTSTGSISITLSEK